MTDGPLLGRDAPVPDHYAPDILTTIARADARAILGLADELPFTGWDIWNAWDLTWLGAGGLPQTAAAEIRVPAETLNLVESKSVKLYLGSFAMTPFESSEQVGRTIAADLGRRAGGPVSVRMRTPKDHNEFKVRRLPGQSVDDSTVTCSTWNVNPKLLSADDATVVSEELHSHLLYSLCPVTAQPDLGSLAIAYSGPRIDRHGLLRYIVSYRRHQDFHEACVERLFVDILARCRPTRLTVYARYQRRGGIDINPFRSNAGARAANTRTWRQ